MEAPTGAAPQKFVGDFVGERRRTHSYEPGCSRMTMQRSRTSTVFPGLKPTITADLSGIPKLFSDPSGAPRVREIGS